MQSRAAAALLGLKGDGDVLARDPIDRLHYDLDEDKAQRFKG